MTLLDALARTAAPKRAAMITDRIIEHIGDQFPYLVLLMKSNPSESIDQGVTAALLCTFELAMEVGAPLEPFQDSDVWDEACSAIDNVLGGSQEDELLTFVRESYPGLAEAMEMTDREFGAGLAIGWLATAQVFQSSDVPTAPLDDQADDQVLDSMIDDLRLLENQEGVQQDDGEDTEWASREATSVGAAVTFTTYTEVEADEIKQALAALQTLSGYVTGKTSDFEVCIPIDRLNLDQPFDLPSGWGSLAIVSRNGQACLLIRP